MRCMWLEVNGQPFAFAVNGDSWNRTRAGNTRTSALNPSTAPVPSLLTTPPTHYPLHPITDITETSLAHTALLPPSPTTAASSPRMSSIVTESPPKQRSMATKCGESWSGIS